MKALNVKIFNISGEVRKPDNKIRFNLRVRGVKAEDAVERVLSELGGRYKAKRFEIRIERVEEEPQQLD
ncbi:MAG: 50S ribosomal protein L18Ae, partial [Candidatus Bathyarchaeia archaeon]